MTPGIGVLYGVSRKPGHLLEYRDLTPACGALQRRTECFPSYSWDQDGEFKRKQVFLRRCLGENRMWRRTLRRRNSRQNNMFLSIREGIEEGLQKISKLRTCMEDSDCCFDHIEYHLRDGMVTRIRDVKTAQKKDVVGECSQTAPQPAPRSTPDTRKWLRGTTVTPRISRKEEECVKVPDRKDLW